MMSKCDAIANRRDTRVVNRHGRALAFQTPIPSRNHFPKKNTGEPLLVQGKRIMDAADTGAELLAYDMTSGADLAV